MIILTITVNLRSNKYGEFLSALRFFTEKTRAKNGCRSCRIYQDMNNDHLVGLEGTWEHRSDLEDYFCSDIFNALMGAMKLLGKTWDLQINDGSLSEGMEAVNRVQSKKRK